MTMKFSLDALILMLVTTALRPTPMMAVVNILAAWTHNRLIMIVWQQLITGTVSMTNVIPEGFSYFWNDEFNSDSLPLSLIHI